MDESSPEEPKDRLRRARENAGWTTAELAHIVNRSPSSVRAHESGQNKIRVEAASKYAAALGISRNWLLFGEGGGLVQPEQAADFIIQVPLLGEIRRGTWMETTEPQDYYNLFFDKMDMPVSLEAFRLEQDIPGYRIGSILFSDASRPLDYMRNGEDWIFSRRSGNLVEYTLRRISIERPGEQPKALNFGHGAHKASVAPIEPSEELGHPEGRVIGFQWFAP